jgi:hypothetical protein
MGIPLKLTMFFMVNFLALGYLVWYLMKTGNTYRQALRVAWDLIIFNQNEILFNNGSKRTGWCNLLKWTWRLMLLLYFLHWIISNAGSSLIFILILLFHGYWYIHATVFSGRIPDRILFTNDIWGIIYLEVTPGSGFYQKSLAELDLRKKNLLVLAVERDGRTLPFPKGIEILRPGDRILLFGELSSYRMVNS